MSKRGPFYNLEDYDDLEDFDDPKESEKTKWQESEEEDNRPDLDDIFDEFSEKERSKFFKIYNAKGSMRKKLLLQSPLGWKEERRFHKFEKTMEQINPVSKLSPVLEGREITDSPQVRKQYREVLSNNKKTTRDTVHSSPFKFTRKLSTPNEINTTYEDELQAQNKDITRKTKAKLITMQEGPTLVKENEVSALKPYHSPYGMTFVPLGYTPPIPPDQFKKLQKEGQPIKGKLVSEPPSTSDLSIETPLFSSSQSKPKSKKASPKLKKKRHSPKALPERLSSREYSYSPSTRTSSASTRSQAQTFSDDGLLEDLFSPSYIPLSQSYDDCLNNKRREESKENKEEIPKCRKKNNKLLT